MAQTVSELIDKILQNMCCSYIDIKDPITT